LLLAAAMRLRLDDLGFMKIDAAGFLIGKLAICLIIGCLHLAEVSAASISVSHPRRLVTTEDLISLRDIDTLSVSPDGRSYAILVRHADVESNSYRTRWFVGSVSGDRKLIDIGDGGEARLRESPTGRRVGIIVGNPGRWSPDSTRLAYTALRHGEVQLWVSDVRTGFQRQVTHNDSDIRDFVWDEDGKQLIFAVGDTRAAIARLDEEGRRRGFLLEEFQYYSEIVHSPRPWRPFTSDLSHWVVAADGTYERPADEAERERFKRLKQFSWGRNQAVAMSIAGIGGAAAPPVVSHAGMPAWLARESDAETGVLPMLRLHASKRRDGSDPIRCEHEACIAQLFSKIWWSEDGRQVIFWRKQGANLIENAFFAWDPVRNVLRRIFHQDGDEFRECELAGARLICARETLSRPDHVVAIDTRTGAIEVLADVNPRFDEIALGKVERFEWDTPEDQHGLGSPRRMFGYVIYPPAFDARQRYPVFIAPYGAPGFRRGDVGDEHPLFVYAANGFVVISTHFPVATEPMRWGTGADVAELYSAERGFPHLKMYAGSTWNALDAVASRGFIDHERIGIGGVSHGSFVPLYMMLQSDRLSAVATASTGWSQTEYYFATRTGRTLEPPRNWPSGASFWSQLDIADNVEKIEAPLLTNYADREFFHSWRVPRSMEDGGRAYETYIFPDEYHVKWQPAHRFAIYNRNLDWFRFWLQDIEDPDPSKTSQYERWRALRELQCRNPRSVRDYCSVKSIEMPPAR
jgi:dipeptidyl aminopeptidase/acylaminoacyl peptidase